MMGSQRRADAGPALVLVALAVLLASTTVRAGTQPNPVLRVDSGTAGQVGLDAHGVSIDEALQAIASEAGFEVVIEPGMQRPPVNVALSMAPVEDILRQILRGRNYALVYDADANDPSLSRVIVLPPPAPGKPVPFSRAMRARRR
jgi:hypothetical protein